MQLEKVLQLDNIVFYDGDCGFCNTSVQKILKYRKSDFYFIPLQSKLAQQIMEIYKEKMDMNTLYLIQSGKLYDRSNAVIRIAKKLSSFFPILFYLGILIPRSFRDWIYRQIAKRRHKIQPKHCALPSQEEKLFFISEDV